MKINGKLRSSINKYAHAEGMRIERVLKRQLLEEACEYQRLGRTIDEIRALLSISYDPESGLRLD